jgi:hypothetical protein
LAVIWSTPLRAAAVAGVARLPLLLWAKEAGSGINIAAIKTNTVTNFRISSPSKFGLYFRQGPFGPGAWMQAGPQSVHPFLLLRLCRTGIIRLKRRKSLRLLQRARAGKN